MRRNQYYTIANTIEGLVDHLLWEALWTLGGGLRWCVRGLTLAVGLGPRGCGRGPGGFEVGVDLHVAAVERFFLIGDPSIACPSRAFLCWHCRRSSRCEQLLYLQFINDWILVLPLLGCRSPLLFDDPYLERFAEARFVTNTLNAGRLPTMTGIEAVRVDQIMSNVKLTKCCGTRTCSLERLGGCIRFYWNRGWLWQ